MKTYLEIKEQLTEEEKQVKQPQEIRIEVADKKEAISKLAVFKSVFKGLKYVKQVHYCRHSEGLPCKVEELGTKKEML